MILTSHRAAAGDLPKDQAHGVDVSSLERLKVFHVYGVVQDLRSHVPEQKDNALLSNYNFNEVMALYMLLG